MPIIKWDSSKWGTFYWSEGVTIGGTYYECVRNMVITDLLTKEANTASFEIFGTYSDKPTEGEEVVIKHHGVKIFNGRVVRISPRKLSGSDFVFAIHCVDWQVDLDKKLVVETYTDETLYNIIDDINTKYLTGFTINNVINPGATIDRIQFNYQYPSECFQELAEITGYDWYVDYDKDIHFFVQDTNTAPIELLDGGTEFENLRIIPDISQLANRIWVRGGWYKSNTYTQDTITAAAGQEEFPIVYRPHDFAVTVGGVGKTVGIENQDAPGSNDFLLNADEKLLKIDTISMAGGEAVVMSYTYEIPILARVDKLTSQTAIAAIQGGDGVYEKYIVDEYIETIDQAIERGNAELTKYANTMVNGSFYSFQTGWRTGQQLHIDLTDRNIDKYYLIREVKIIAIGGNKLRYEIKFATQLLGFTWMLIKMLDELRPKVIRDDEILSQLYQFEENEISVSDATPTTSLVTPPYQYGPGGSPQGVYNESQWG